MSCEALRLAQSRIAVNVTVDGERVVIAVHDDGPGFKDEIKAALGERFTPCMGARGLGLSISMAKEVLAAHGGSLEVEASRLPPGRRGGQGAAVVLTLPVKRS
jgi:signal transduction histidine kinase